MEMDKSSSRAAGAGELLRLEARAAGMPTPACPSEVSSISLLSSRARSPARLLFRGVGDGAGVHLATIAGGRVGGGAYHVVATVAVFSTRR